MLITSAYSRVKVDVSTLCFGRF